MTLVLAQGMERKLETLDSDYRTHHHWLIDIIESDEALAVEQEALDHHDDFVGELCSYTEPH